MAKCNWCGEYIWGNTYYEQSARIGSGPYAGYHEGGAVCSEKCYYEWLAKETDKWEAQHGAASQTARQPQQPRADLNPGGRNCTTCRHFSGCFCEGYAQDNGFAQDPMDQPVFTAFHLKQQSPQNRASTHGFDEIFVENCAFYTLFFSGTICVEFPGEFPLRMDMED